MMKRYLIMLQVFLLLFLSACKSGPEGPDSQQNERTLHTAAEDRCAITAHGRMSETDTGYYMLRGDYLFYADQTDLSNWVLVCNRPECKHKRDECPAYAVLSPFWLKDDGIYYVTDCIDGELLEQTSIVRTSLDGATQEVVFTDPGIETAGAATAIELTPDACYFCFTRMNEDGTMEYSIVRVDANGVKTLFSLHDPEIAETYSVYLMPMTYGHSIRGDMTVRCVFPLDESLDLSQVDKDTGVFYYYQVHGDTLREIPLTDNCTAHMPEIYHLYGAFIQDDLLFHYHVNDGFYRMDLSTGEEIKIADAAYQNAFGHCIDGELMIECTMGVPGVDSSADTPQMRYFDGTSWHELELPESWDVSHRFRVVAGASDRIFFTVMDSNTNDAQVELAYIMLGEDSFTICDRYPFSISFDE